MSDIPYKEYKQQEDEVIKLLKNKDLFVSFTNEELIERGIYFIPPGEDVRFVSEASMALFERYSHNKLKILKLHNYGRPATSVRFNSKHKYATYRNVNKMDVQDMIVIELHLAEENFAKAIENLDLEDPDQLALIKNLEEEYQNKTNTLKYYLENIDSFEFTLSSYFKYYTYYQVTIRYRENGTTGYIEQHIARTKANIIFISEELSHKHKEHKHKKIQKYLQSLDQVLSRNTTDLFAQKIKG